MVSHRTVRVTLYTKQDCHLCEEAKQLLSALGERFSLVVDEVDIASRERLRGRYRELVPVVKIEAGPSLFGEIDPDRLRQAISAAAVADAGELRSD